MVSLSMEIQGADKLIRSFDMLIKDTSKLKGFFGEAIEKVKEHADDIFKSQGRDVRTANKRSPLASSTKKARDNRRGHYSKSPRNPGILRRTGNLQDNVTMESTNTRGMLKYNAPYAMPHLVGGKGGPPKRKFLELDPGTNAEIVRILQTKIQKDIQNFNNAKGGF